MQAPVVTILYYHSIQTGDRQGFARQMDLLLKYSEPVSASQDHSLKRGRFYTSVTFDDGFSSIGENALPEMRLRNIPAVIFMSTGYLGRNPGWLADTDDPQREETIMDEVMIRSLTSPLTHIGSHCISHTDLRLLDGDQALRELTVSKRTLEDITGKAVDLLSFPHGGYNEHIIRLAKTAGYTHAYSILPARGTQAGGGFIKGRTFASPRDWSCEFYLKIKGAYQWLPLGSAFKRLLAERLR